MIMANDTTRFIPDRKKGCRCLIFYEIIAFGIAIAVIQHANGFLYQQSTQNLANQNHKNPLTREHRMPFFQSQKSGASLGATAKLDSNIPKESPPKNDEVDDDDETSSFQGLLKLASMHCASQALNTAVKLKIPNLLGDQQLSVEELSEAIEAASDRETDDQLSCNKDALLRTMRLLTTIDVVREEKTANEPASSLSTSMSTYSSFSFSLTPLGRSLRTTDDGQQPSMASCILHWMEEPLWDSWLELPSYIQDGGDENELTTLLPFERANGGVSSDDWYNQEDHPESLNHANDFVRLVHDRELKAVVKGFDWSLYKNQRLVDVAGNNGKLAQAIASFEPTLDCSCLDLPSVIANVPSGKEPENVTLVPGNVLDPNTIPDCEVILMKHFCDRCMWYDDQTVEILRSCNAVLRRSSENDKHDDDSKTATTTRRIVIADAVLPDCGTVNETNELPLYLDALYMLVGRERQRTRSEWKALAGAADLELVSVIYTDVPSCSLIILEPKP